ncbi:hypothetical protein [Actinomadura gamaensis]|uniref:Uncharacterized protein n=1 Tax=Actinomadura gamaensis TaxID=1763541 RepID=A0ABV9U9G8_9ACTN
MIVSASFAELHTLGWLERLTHRCRARSVETAAIWVNSERGTMRKYSETRDTLRDRWKLSHLGRVQQHP